MGELILDSLEIRGFRALEHLTIERLGRVNLIVGKNGVGKSSVLEALHAYAHLGDPSAFVTILASRDEFGLREVRRETEADRFVAAFEPLICRRRIDWNEPEQMYIGPVRPSTRGLSLSLQLFSRIRSSDGTERLERVHSGRNGSDIDEIRLAAQFGEQLTLHRLEAELFRPWERDEPEYEEIPSTYVSTQGLDSHTIAGMWDDVALTDAEQDTVDALRLIVPGIQRIALVERKDVRRDSRIAIARVEGERGPVPLRSLGDGLTRMFGLVLGVVSSQHGLLLVDEIDTGLHYSVLKSMWLLVLRLAASLNVQVFATTHSWECIAAFQEATAESAAGDGMLIRLERRNGTIIPVLFDDGELAIATRVHIEVR